MSLLRSIKWKKIALISLMALVVVLSLLNAASSAGGKLTSKAYTVTQDWVTRVPISTSQQWNILDNYTIYRRQNLSYSSDIESVVYYTSLVFSGCTNNDYSLEYYVKIFAYGTNTLLYESTWFDNNDECFIYMNPRTSTTSNSYEIYVRRKADENGNRGYLVPSDMRPSTLLFKGLYQYDYQVQTLPNDWFATTTQSLSSYTTQTTVVTTVDYESYVTTLTIPTDVRYALSFFESIIYSLWRLKYIPFIVIFALIVALCGWLLH